MNADAVTERTGGRNARVRAAALGALAELLAEMPAELITASEVARRSGVNRSTLHRRWGGVPGMMADLAVEDLNVSSPIPDDAGDLRTELLCWANRVVEVLNKYPHGRSPFVASIVNLASSGGAPAGLFAARIEVLEQIFARATARGDQIDLSANDLVEIVLLPIYATRLFTTGPIPSDLAPRLVDRFLVLNR